MACFRINNEMERIDFTDNDSWFNIKLMISTHDYNVNLCKSFDNSNVTYQYKFSYVGLMKIVYNLAFVIIKETSLKVHFIKQL